MKESGIGGDHVRDGTHQRGTCLGCEESKTGERLMGVERRRKQS